MEKFKKNPVSIDHQHKNVMMTEEQIAANKKLLVHGKDGYKTKGGYQVYKCIKYGNYYMPYAMLQGIIWQSMRCLQILYHTNGNDKRFVAATARALHIHNLLLKGSLTTNPLGPASDAYTLAIAKSEGMYILQDILSMSDAERDSLEDKDYAIHHADKDMFTINGEEICCKELAGFIRLGCKFLFFDADTTFRGDARSAILYGEAVPGMCFSLIINGESPTEAIEHFMFELPGFDVETIEKVCNNYKAA